MWTSRAPAFRSCATTRGVVVPRTMLSSTTTTRLPRSTSGSGLSFSATLPLRWPWLGWMNVRPM